MTEHQLFLEFNDWCGLRSYDFSSTVYRCADQVGIFLQSLSAHRIRHL